MYKIDFFSESIHSFEAGLFLAWTFGFQLGTVRSSVPGPETRHDGYRAHAAAEAVQLAAGRGASERGPEDRHRVVEEQNRHLQCELPLREPVLALCDAFVSRHLPSNL